MKNTNILIVEDDEFFSTSLKLKLEKENYHVIGIASSGEVALEQIEKSQPDIILMDIILGGKLDGIETTKIINEKWKIPVLYITASVEENIIDRAKKTEPFGIISKNFVKNELKLQISLALYKHAADIEQRRLYQEISYNQDILSNIVSASRDAVFFIDSDFKVTFWNTAAQRIFGYTAHAAQGQSIIDLIISEQYFEDFTEGLIKARNHQNSDIIGNILEMYAKKKSGKLFACEMKLSNVYIKDKWYACGFARDVTERIIAEEELTKLIEEIQASKDIIEQHANELVGLNLKLAESEEQLQELNASKDKFFSIISHDLRGPFQGLLGYSEVMVREFDSLTTAEHKEYSQNINQTAENLYKLLENLLHWSRLQRGIVEFNPEHTNLKFLTDINLDLIKPRIMQKGIKIKNHINEDIFIYVDINMINTVLRNLLSNAVKFTKNGDIIELKALIKDNDTVLVQINDTGVGMSKEAMKKIFRIDQHHTTAGTSNEQGTGLGLILCKELVEKNNGKISVESEINKGTTFSFTLALGKNCDFLRI